MPFTPTVIVQGPVGLPRKTRTLLRPLEGCLSIISICAEFPTTVISSTPSMASSQSVQFRFVLSPQVPACSPVAILSNPLFLVYVEGIYALSSQRPQEPLDSCC